MDAPLFAMKQVALSLLPFVYKVHSPRTDLQPGNTDIEDKFILTYLFSGLQWTTWWNWLLVTTHRNGDSLLLWWKAQVWCILAISGIADVAFGRCMKTSAHCGLLFPGSNGYIAGKAHLLQCLWLSVRLVSFCWWWMVVALTVLRCLRICRWYIMLMVTTARKRCSWW